MRRTGVIVIAVVLAAGAASWIGCSQTTAPKEEAVTSAPVSSRYDDLVALHKEFRELQRPKEVNGVPDYSTGAVQAQAAGLKTLQARLLAMDISQWSVPQQVDYHVVRGEMNGADFNHRVLKPWSTDPDFYLPGRMSSRLPASDEAAATLKANLEAVPVALQAARQNLNLAEARADLVSMALQSIQYVGETYQALGLELAKKRPDLVPVAEKAKAALDEYGRWLEQNRAQMKGRSGVGKENYDWWLKNVWLMPYTWDECWAISQREYERTATATRIEEVRNRKLPQLEPAPNEAEFNRQWQAVETHVLKFMREEPYFTVPDYLVAIGPRPYATWADHPGRRDGALPFFLQVADRDPMMEVIHNTLGHNFDSLRSRSDSRPIRGERRLYGLSKARSEAWAFTLEEWLMNAGIIDKAMRGPRGREIIYIAAAYRAVRAMADLMLHSQEATYDGANEFEAAMTPRGWTSPDNFTTWSHRRPTPRVPGNEMGYLIGKVQFEKTLADRARQLGDKFDFKAFVDEFVGAGMIPISLIRWEMTGLDDEMKKVWPGKPEPATTK